MPILETDPLGKYIRNSFDEAGNLTKIERGQNNQVISTLDNIFDDKNRLKEKFVGSVREYTFTYDRTDNLLETTLANGQKYTNAYDENSRLLTSQEPGGYLLTNTYDNTGSAANGLRTKYEETFHGVTETTSFVYDSLQNVNSITGPKGGITSFFYSEQGYLNRIRAGSTHINQEFDDAGRVTQQTILANTPLRVNYTYDPSGYIQTYQEGNNLHQYAYDFAGRLNQYSLLK